jgi:chlorobactene glucosyltransferase
MTSLITALASASVCAWGAAIVAMRHNGRFAPSIDHEELDETAAGARSSVCVVVPARDEEKNIGACLDALRRSDYPRLRIRVVDDASTDGTERIVADATRVDPRVEIMPAGALPEGWLGKSHALWIGTRGLGEDWLLFVDADLRVSPSCIARAVAAAERLGADLLTVVPAIETWTFWESAAQSIVAHAILLFLDTRAVNDPTSKRAAAIGPLMLFRRSAYEAIGGHRAVRREVVEDLRLAEACKRAGHRLVLARGPAVASLRMYDSLGAIVRGWSKNAHVVLQGKLYLAPLVVLGLLFFFGAPWILLLASVARADRAGAVASTLAVVATIAARIDFERLFGVAARRAYLAPLGAVVLSWIVLRSVVDVARGRPSVWKGRLVT